MINMNLKTDASSDRQKIVFGNAIPLAVTLLVIIVLGYAAILIYTKKINDQISKTEMSYIQKLDDLKKGNAKNVFDFQNRLSESKKLLSANYNSTDNLRELEKIMIPGVYLNGYEFDGEKKSLRLECIASNYNDVAKQILSFKKSEYFSSVVAGETSLSDKDGKIIFGVNLNIVNK